MTCLPLFTTQIVQPIVAWMDWSVRLAKPTSEKPFEAEKFDSCLSLNSIQPARLTTALWKTLYFQLLQNWAREKQLLNKKTAV